jgi:hypothetical protein
MAILVKEEEEKEDTALVESQDIKEISLAVLVKEEETDLLDMKENMIVGKFTRF